MGNSSSQMTIIIDENNGLSQNQMFEASEVYLRTKITPSVSRLKVSKAPREKNFSVTVNKGEKIIDAFEDIQVIWQVTCTENQKKSTDYEGGFSNENVERKSIELSFHKEHREKVLSSYLSYVLERAKAIKEEDKVVKLYSLGRFHGYYDGSWRSVNLDHPSTFDTLAMDPPLKKELMDDLDRFVKRREFYKRVGKAWKRGYLLYGPPGTGKSSLIAAMANYLKFHIYDLELTSLLSNSDLRSILASTANRSILVIEDIDCSSDFQKRQAGGNNNVDSQLTLSGLLNFIDGLWSSCGDERIIIFTTNHKDRLDPALLRPGRMDIHIHMSYCTPSGFKILASNYLGINNHSMFTEIEKLITEVEVTPAEIAEELMKSEDADTALEGLLNYLHTKEMEHGKANVEGEKEARGKEQESEEISSLQFCASRSREDPANPTTSILSEDPATIGKLPATVSRALSLPRESSDNPTSFGTL
ncbi:P-loop containing nucleoside triphosphate hydrolases superfamily protein [Actinidia rufa]|uniref:P-loop containing nucleoside triphosphate hydrolases superfamily protein n=1 Tax=Actinidia rufa TaxID=165716 RepID=A0A7J0EPM3_9ERIC|nr:P-loop containing nucleoside triphosphate hydrolases superfamily protein [Actinidia rufa]